MMRGPTIYHNGTPYNADLNVFLSLSPLLHSLYLSNSYLPLYIKDGLTEAAFQNLVSSINDHNCLNVLNTNNIQDILLFLESALVYHVHQFIEETCQFIANKYKEHIITVLNLISQYSEISSNLDQYIISNLKSFCKDPQFLAVEYFILLRIFENVNRNTDLSKDTEIINFIIKYVKNKGKECSLLFQFVDFNCVFKIDNGTLLENLIHNDLIDFDFLGEKIVNDLKKSSTDPKKEKTQNNTINKNNADKQIESLEAKISNTEKECQAETEKIEELKNEQNILQAESDKVDNFMNSVNKQSTNASNKIALLQKEKAELEQKLALLIQQEEEIKSAPFDDEIEPEEANQNTSEAISNNNSTENISNSTEISNKQSMTNLDQSTNSTQSDQNLNNSQQQQSGEPSMQHWCPKPKLTPPEQPFIEDIFYENIQKADKQMKIYPTEALKKCFLIFNVDIDKDGEDNFASKLGLIDPNDRATLLDFLTRSSIEFNQPEIAASLASLLAATDESCDDFAASLFLDAAKKNIPEAMLNAGVMARLGRGIAQNDKIAAHMIVKAANSGLDEAISMAKLASP
ncbi:hypothetical protein M9Y10_024245 [Tritrichomonas musculus]|uniref:Uncharacterized protein n=1 Tax=Tritrichomonas musculus TaxID=1915356 RepID=A0ABR2HCG8_9EUKA